MKMEAAGAGRDPSQPVQVAKMAYCDAHTPAHVLQVKYISKVEGKKMLKRHFTRYNYNISN